MKFKLLLLFLLVFGTIYAQIPAKKSLSISDFASWNLINNPQISDNGKVVIFELNKQKGDGCLIVNSGNSHDTIQRAYNAKLGSQSDFALFKIKPSQHEIKKAKLDKVKKEKMPADSLGIFLFKSKKLLKYPKIKSFLIAEENTTWAAFLLEKSEAKTDTAFKSKNKKLPKQPGDKLVLFNIHTTDTLQFNQVVDYAVAKNGSAIYFVQQTVDTLKNTFSSLKVFNTETQTLNELMNQAGWIKKTSVSNDGNQYAFLLSADTIKEKTYALYFGENLKTPEIIVDENTSGIPVGYSPSENGRIYFSDDQSKIYFGTAKSPEPEPKDTLLDEEKPKLDIWNWKDKKLQPQQLIEASREKKRTYLAVYFTTKKEFIQLADLNIRSIRTLKKGNLDIGLGTDDSPYIRSFGWTGKSLRDYYLVDFATGIKRELIKQKNSGSLSPAGKYFIWYNETDSSYYAKSTDINHPEEISLTHMIPVSFYNEIDDRPTEPRPYGIAGWSDEDRFVYIYDRYDIWKIDPSGERVPVNVTKTFGRRNKTRLRYVKLDKELDFIPVNETILLSAFDERTMSSGYFSTKLNAIKDPDLLVMDKASFGRTMLKAKNDDKLLWTKENVKTYPDLWCSNLRFEHVKRMSDANPQIKDYNWPKVELVEWTSFSGEKLKGLLYTPENLDKNSKYPLLVYFYERSSEGMYRHSYPRASHSTINIPFYVSNNYVVFVPDITYKIGYPGQSAYNAIVSGTKFLVQKYPFINEKKMGLQGQSWGGYQTAYLITQTDMYAAAMAGAPVSNMTSAYGGIRWGTGISRMHQYEHTQSRIGGTLWEKPLFYIENSPVFYAPKVKTPLLMMHNDKDTAVPWWQGIEMFVALRRLDKPVWMLTYNGEPHNLPTKSWANRVDLSTRMFQFFNHYLKDKPAPEWMEKGVPAIEKGKNLGY